jgi:hypothetical protein
MAEKGNTQSQYFNAECPLCGAPVVTAPTTMLGGMMTGPMFSPQTREELIAACRVHGKSPFNDGTLIALGLKARPSPPRASRSERWALSGLIGFYLAIGVIVLVALLLTRR